MIVTVRLFARAREIVGTDTVNVELPDDAHVGDLRRQLVEEHRALEPLAQHLLIAVGTDYTTDDLPLTDGCELAAFPPVSGG